MSEPSCSTAAGRDASLAAAADASSTTRADGSSQVLSDASVSARADACAWCKGPIPAIARRDSICCSVRCRQARHRLQVLEDASARA